MFDLIVTGLVAAPAIRIAADIGTWCFNSAAELERDRQWQIVRETRAALRAERELQWEIEQEARQQAFEEMQAAHQAHHLLLQRVWEEISAIRQDSGKVRKQFVEISKENDQTLTATALTPEQRAAVIECNQHLARGIARLSAYIGPYLQSYVEQLREAQQALKSHDFVIPDAPSAVLPDDYPYVGELYEFAPSELMEFPFVRLSGREVGRFIGPNKRTLRGGQRMLGLVSRYDRDSRTWVLSAAKGALLEELDSGTALIEAREVTLENSRHEIRFARWRHESGESLLFRVQSSALDDRVRRAPWGTKTQVFVHGADYTFDKIDAGPTVARENVLGVGTYRCIAPSEFWSRYEFASEFSNRLLVREAGLPGDPTGMKLVVRLSTGEEYPITSDTSRNCVVIDRQCGSRLGLVKEGGRQLLIFVFRGEFLPEDSDCGDDAKEFFDAIEQSFDEQRELLELIDIDNLELKKYSTILEAEFEAASRRQHQSVEFSDWRIDSESVPGRFLVEFRVPFGTQLTGALRLAGSVELVGWVQDCDATNGVLTVVVPREQRRRFANHSVPLSGKLELLFVNRELQNKVDATQQFVSASAVAQSNQDDQAAFSAIRRELLGRFSLESTDIGSVRSTGGSSGLDAHQERAVSIMTGNDPVVLIQGPPGTGKTHVISHAISRMLEKDKKARIAITSQANPAVDEAVAKIQSAFPGIQIFRDYSASAKEKYASLDRGVGVEEYFDELVRGIRGSVSEDEPRIQEACAWLKESVEQDGDFWRREIRRMLSNGSQIVACTLSRLAALSGSGRFFDLVIVDEAAKASVPETMIAANCARRLALVGDHHQLLPYLDESYFEHSAPTNEDRALLENLWRDSLFARLWRAAPDSRKAFLATMRRSRRPIAECISTCFYDGELRPGRDNRSPSVPIPVALMWVDSVKGRHWLTDDMTIENPIEASLVISSVREIKKFCDPSVSVGVVAFHRGQAELLRKAVATEFASDDVHVLTVDASQGGQWDVVILSLGRSEGSTRFVGDANRLNVAISRAKELCLIVGSLAYATADLSQGNALRPVAEFLESQPKFGKWICKVTSDVELPPAFRFPDNWLARP